jgi:hypothetical protein
MSTVPGVFFQPLRPTLRGRNDCPIFVLLPYISSGSLSQYTLTLKYHSQIIACFVSFRFRPRARRHRDRTRGRLCQRHRVAVHSARAGRRLVSRRGQSRR